MPLLRALMVLTVSLASIPAQAAILEYQFSGTISATHEGTTILLGDTFTASWRIETSQPGQSISAPGFNGRQYELGSLEIAINDESATAEGGVVFVSESSVDAAFLETWPSGSSSDYVASVVTQGLQRWGVDISRMQIVFSYDGLGRWDNLALPGHFEFLHEAVGSVVRIETTSGEFGSGGEIIGRIDSVVATAVPLPSPSYLLASALSLLAVGGKSRRNLQRTST